MTKFKHPYVTVDCVVFGFDEGDLKIILIQRANAPFKNKWALPGGFVRLNESLEQAAIRELKEETGIKDVFLEQLYTFGRVGRDPRTRVITVAYYALVNRTGHLITAATDAKTADWFLVKQLPMLAFDHQTIIDTALTRLRGKVRYEPIGFELLPEKFTLSRLQHLYEVILERNLDKRNFRKKILSMKLLIALNEREKDVAHRAAQLYKFDAQKYKELKRRGFNFEI
ncbi:MAG: NUDIX hydrolase [Candidatus Omnitrophica bacterium]|nr:NUDIX hydrolase [Candidatus Omnitrophota bacterium]MBU4479394.1 NUDIX hydrolase [Candidatus Omnitrophota bacterium]